MGAVAAAEAVGAAGARAADVEASSDARSAASMENMAAAGV